MAYTEISNRGCDRCGKVFKRTNQHKFVCPTCFKKGREEREERGKEGSLGVCKINRVKERCSMDEQLLDVVMVVGFAEVSDEGVTYATSKVVRLDVQGPMGDFVEYVKAYGKVVHSE